MTFILNLWSPHENEACTAGLNTVNHEENVTKGRDECGSCRGCFEFKTHFYVFLVFTDIYRQLSQTSDGSTWTHLQPRVVEHELLLLFKVRVHGFRQ